LRLHSPEVYLNLSVRLKKTQRWNCFGKNKDICKAHDIFIWNDSFSMFQHRRCWRTGPCWEVAFANRNSDKTLKLYSNSLTMVTYLDREIIFLRLSVNKLSNLRNCNHLVREDFHEDSIIDLYQHSLNVLLCKYLFMLEYQWFQEIIVEYETYASRSFFFYVISSNSLSIWFFDWIFI
jgi:hypothetical protein